MVGDFFTSLYSTRSQSSYLWNISLKSLLNCESLSKEGYPRQTIYNTINHMQLGGKINGEQEN